MVSSSKVEWQQCKKIVNKECGDAMRTYVFSRGDEEGTVSLDCCFQLVEMGKACHESILDAHLKSPLFKYKTNISKILERNAKIWNQCSYVVKGKSPPPFKRARTKSRKCKIEVGRSIFNGAGIEKVSHECCGELIHMEKRRHDKIVQARLARENNLFEKKRKQVLEASTKVWNRCAFIAHSLPDFKSCKSKISKSRGIQVGRNVLFSEGSISQKCCIQLHRLGRDCHELIALTDVALPQFQALSKDILNRNNHAWIMCLKNTEN